MVELEILHLLSEPWNVKKLDLSNVIVVTSLSFEFTSFSITTFQWEIDFNQFEPWLPLGDNGSQHPTTCKICNMIYGGAPPRNVQNCCLWHKVEDLRRGDNWIVTLLDVWNINCGDHSPELCHNWWFQQVERTFLPGKFGQTNSLSKHWPGPIFFSFKNLLPSGPLADKWQTIIYKQKKNI